MLGPVRDALQQLHLTLEADEFDASNSSRAFTIATNDYAARVVIPALVHQVAKLAPSVVLDVRSIDHLDVLDQLDAGVVDVALSTLLEGGDRFRCAGLLDDEYVVVLSRDHPAVTAPELSLERFSALPHINISSADDDARFIDDALAARGLARRTFAHVPLYSLVPILTHLQALAVVPRRVAAGLATHYPLTIRALPFSSPRITVFMIWHRQLDNYPANRWLRNALRLSHPCRAAL
jgi:DNA-binding transcriptional LysR family regulator